VVNSFRVLGDSNAAVTLQTPCLRRMPTHDGSRMMRTGWYGRRARRDRMRAKLKEIKEELRRRMHQPIPEQGKWLKQVVTGYFAYHAVLTNGRALMAFRFHIANLWRRTLKKRSQKDQTTWDRITKLTDDWLPKPRILHPLASPTFRRQAPEVGAGCPNRARPDLCGGRSAMSVPTAIEFSLPRDVRRTLRVLGGYPQMAGFCAAARPFYLPRRSAMIG